eukprot:CAMPEP_0184870418 /NCGR_PEP_ID=MMETSP0580-20130426/37389_1 /TAXON_ID=1118495 /ORGANISM="Dactyliosolen fragilissimus" /LENGTH=216 /DNA_ID=CAMNT_0027372467 /DNA_START=250 /DNA_END=896 /DNA_ORIENTATION=-
MTMPTRISIRQGTKADEIMIATTMAKELMNPLGIKGKNFYIAEIETGKRVGWVQIRPLGPSMVDPNTFDSSPGSIDLENAVDEDIWEEFEKEDIDFPNGLASLPWTKEYRDAAASAAERRDRRAMLMSAKRMEAGQIWELASLYVLPEYRCQGIGSLLVKKILTEHGLLGRSFTGLYLLTLAKTVEWYNQFGFDAVNGKNIPDPMRFEVAAGSVIT